MVVVVVSGSVRAAPINPPSPSEFKKRLENVHVTGNQVKQEVQNVYQSGYEAAEETVKNGYYDLLQKEAGLIRNKERNPSKYLQVLKEEGQHLVTSVVNAVEQTIINQSAHYVAQHVNQYLTAILGEQIGGFLANYTEGLIKGALTPEKVLKDGMDRIVDWLAGKVEGLGFPPKISIGLRKTLNVGGKKIQGYNRTDAQTVGLEGTLNDYPDPFVEETCLKTGKNDPACRLLFNMKTDDFVGVCVYGSVNQPYEEIKKDLSQSVSVCAAGSTVESLEPGGEQIQKKRVEMMTRAVVDSASYVPVGKKALEKVPKPLKFKYAKVASDGAFRDAYLKSLQRRLIAHYAALIALHKEVEAICSIPQKPVLENCSVGGGLVSSVVSAVAGAASGNVGALSSLASPTGAISQLASLNPSQIVSQVQNFSVENVLSHLQSQSQQFLSQLKKQREQLSQTVEKLKQSFEGRGACCGVCWKAVAQARANAALIKGSTAAIMGAIHTSTNQIIQSISVQECMTRNAIRTEMAQTRAVLLTVECLDLHLKEQQMLMEIDSLEAQVAQTGALLTMLQNAEFRKLRQEYQKIVAEGLEFSR